jgi:methyltransferase (TIGR00027 family)
MAAYIAARTAFFDEQLLRACATGTAQVVIVGAGYDGRSLRFRQPQVTFYELDQSATQADKLERTNELGIHCSDVKFVALDVRRDLIAGALATAGHDRSHATFFLCEGLTGYLPSAALRTLLTSLASSAGAGSKLAIDFLQPQRSRSVAGRALLALVRGGTAVMGERLVTLLTPHEAESLLVASGWPNVELQTPHGAFPVVFGAASVN